MESTTETQNLARQLVAYESREDRGLVLPDLAALRVYEKLRASLCKLIGMAGLLSLASRALAMAASQAPRLRAVQLNADGTLQGLESSGPSAANDRLREQEAIILISCLLELLLIFVGKALTMNLVRNAWTDSVGDQIDPLDGRKA